MKYIKNHIVINVFAILLTVSIAVPSIVKFAHIFEDHKHEVCTNNTSTHFHEFDVECEFYKFKVPIQYLSTIDVSNTIETITITNKVYNHYTLLTSTKFNLFELRGPPSRIS